MQLYANLFNLPIEVPEVQEAGTLGAAMCAGVAIGEYKSYKDAVERMVRIQKIYYPEIEYTSVFNQIYDSFQSLIQQLSRSSI
jgi:sugar (pentulose or hexulose) kinase